MENFDVVVVGAGAAGLFGAAMAGQRGQRVLLLDHSPKVAEKIRISGGGRCNFTNREVTPANYLGDNPHFCRSALSQYTSADFIALVKSHQIAFHEKHKGQLFCDRSAQDIIDLLLRECERGQVVRRQPCAVSAVRGAGGEHRFELDTDAGTVGTSHLVVATGGLSIPKIGATDFGFRLAQQFGHRVTPLRPALAPLTFDPAAWARWVPLAGVSLPVGIEVTPAATPGKGVKGKPRPVHFDEDLLFTHRGLSGPAILQISSHWEPGSPLSLNLAPGRDLAAELRQAKTGSRRKLATDWREVLPETVSQRLATAWLEQSAQQLPGLNPEGNTADQKDRDLDALARSAQQWQITPSGTEGYAKAEVTAGGVDTRELSSQTLESKLVPGLHFIGEVVDVTGWLGGYNFQWAWASAMACARGLAQR